MSIFKFTCKYEVIFINLQITSDKKIEMENLITTNTAFNLWANKLIIEWLREQEPIILEKEVLSSFSTIKKLMCHIMEAEKYYISILNNSQAEYESKIRIEDLFEEINRVSTELLKWSKSQSASSLNKEITLNRSSIEEKYTVAEIITHTVNHSTYHRGQLIALRSQLPLTPAPKIDFYRYIMDKKTNKL